MKKITRTVILVCISSSIVFMNASFVSAKLWMCEEVFGSSPLHKEIIFYDSDIGICFGDAVLQYGKDEKKYTIENIFASADAGSSFIVLGGFVTEANGKNLLVPNVFLVQKKPDGAIRGWHFFIQNPLGAPVRTFSQNITAADIHHAFKERLVALFARVSWVPETAGKAEFDAVLMPYVTYISETTSIECGNEEKIF